MARLTADDRKKLPAKDFAGPGRSFPIPDKAHARAALQDIPKADLTLKEAAKIRSAAYKKLGK
ncbi:MULTISPECIES: hypothetical protein [unclassified Bradyrhizobium]|nr:MULTISPECIES: hypothetical protein [unclassified Bradyrhizobium]